MFKYHLWPLFNNCKEYFLSLLTLLSEGTSFEYLCHRQLAFLSSIIPTRFHYPLHLFVIYLLFHLYLLYVICATVARALYKGIKIRGNRLYPAFPEAKEKMTIWITSFFVIHWMSSFLLGANWSFLSDWFFAIRPQLNIKPEVKVIQSTSSTGSICSNCSVDFSIDLDVGLEPGDSTTRALLRNVHQTDRSISTASDFYHSMASEPDFDD